MKKYALIVVVTVLIVNCAFAESTYDIGDVVVTATKTEEKIDEVGSSFNVVTKEIIESSGKSMVGDVLRDIPGVIVVQSGGIGGVTSVYLRGTRPGDTLVLIDGVEVNDPISPTRSFDFANLSVSDIERIEIVRGPQSTLYGSDAIGGVINIITKKGSEKTEASILFEGGSYKTFREAVSIGGEYKIVDYSVTVSRTDSEGISLAKRGSEEDGYCNTTVSTKVGAKLTDSSYLGGIFRYTKATTDLDDASFIDDPDYYSKWENYISKLKFDHKILDWWTYNLSCSYSDIKRKYRDKLNDLNDFEEINGTFKAENIQAEWKNDFYIGDNDILTAGVEYEEEKGSSSYYYSGYMDKFPKESMATWGIYLQNILKLWERLFTTIGIRLDDNNEFGSDTNYRIACSYLHKETNTQIKGTWGTGFKAPTLFQLFSMFGDTDLNPEESTAYDVGFVQKLFSDKVSIGVTYFHNKIKEMINWDAVQSKYGNIGKAVTKGVEAEVYAYPCDVLGVGLNYTYMDTEDKATGLNLLRRPKNKVSFNINWKFLEQGNLNLIVNYIGERKDQDFVTFNRINLDSYFKFDVYCSYDINKNLIVFGKIENLFDEDYEEVYGFNTSGISGYAGAKLKI